MLGAACEALIIQQPGGGENVLDLFGGMVMVAVPQVDTTVMVTWQPLVFVMVIDVQLASAIVVEPINNAKQNVNSKESDLRVFIQTSIG